MFEPYAKYNVSRRLYAASEAGRALMFLVSEKAAAADDVGNLRRHHLVPGFVALSDGFEDVSRKDREVFGIIVIKLHQDATTEQVTVEMLCVGVDVIMGYRWWCVQWCEVV